MNTGGFQTQVSDQPAPAVEGDFASNNPFYTFDAGPGGLVAGALGLLVGRFAWVTNPADPNGTGKIAQNAGAGPVAGFVHRAQQGLIIDYLANAGMKIQPGFMATLMTAGDFWVRNAGAALAENGMKAFANVQDGSVAFAAAGSTPASASATGSSIAASAFSVTGEIAGDVMNVTVVGSGVVRPGSTVTGTNVAPNTKVVNQISGTPGGVGQYIVSQPSQSVASTTLTGAYGTLTVGTLTTTPKFAVGDSISGTNVVDGTVITQIISGDGGSGSTLAVDNNTVVGSTTISSSNAVETKWYARSVGAAGELVKISSQPLG